LKENSKEENLTSLQRQKNLYKNFHMDFHKKSKKPKKYIYE
jgi:hypothetical protein